MHIWNTKQPFHPVFLSGTCFRRTFPFISLSSSSLSWLAPAQNCLKLGKLSLPFHISTQDGPENKFLESYFHLAPEVYHLVVDPCQHQVLLHVGEVGSVKQLERQDLVRQRTPNVDSFPVGSVPLWNEFLDTCVWTSPQLLKTDVLVESISQAFFFIYFLKFSAIFWSCP